MTRQRPTECPVCERVPRRTFLADVGMGFTGLALGAMLAREGIVRGAETGAHAPPDGRPMFPPRAKSVIWIFLSGGFSHLETFDPKPSLNKYAGKTFEETPYRNPADSPLHAQRSRAVVGQVRQVYSKIFPLQIGYRARGESGIEMTDWWPHLADCVDDIAFVRSMYTTDNDHGAENQMHTGRHALDGREPSIGGWVTYGLGTANENLPQFAVLGGPTRPDTRVSIEAHYLGPRCSGVPLAIDPRNPLPYGRRGIDVLPQEQRQEFELIGRLNRLAAVEYPEDAALRARIHSYELAFRMQTAIPEALDLAAETQEVQQLYGLEDGTTKTAGERLLVARRLVERGVRFVQVYPTPYGAWDSHSNLQKLHRAQCQQVDKPVAGLLKDLKRRGLLDETVVVFTTEFGRTPGQEGANGRDHHPHGFTVWLAGAGLKQGVVCGATDELGYHALDPAHYVTDLHATVLHLLGLDSRRLEVPGRQRLEMDFGRPITEIVA